MLIPVPFGFKTINKQCGTVENVPCPNCTKATRFTLIKNKTVGTVLFIPVASTLNATYVCCAECGAVYVVDKKDFKKIRDASDVINAIVSYAENQKSGKLRRDLKKEQKKLRIIGLIMLIAGFAGIPVAALSNITPLFMLSGLCAAIGCILLVRSRFHSKYRSNNTEV